MKDQKKYVLVKLRSNAKSYINMPPEKLYTQVLLYLPYCCFHYSMGLLYSKTTPGNEMIFTSEQHLKRFIKTQNDQFILKRSEMFLLEYDKYVKIRDAAQKDFQEKRKAITNRRFKLSNNQKEFTRNQIKEYVDKLIDQSEKHKLYRPLGKRYHEQGSLKTTPQKTICASVRNSKPRTNHSVTQVTPLQTYIDSTTFYGKIFLKDRNGGGYLKVPTDGGTIHLVESKKDATIFPNSNLSRYMIGEVRSRSYMCYYHDWDLYEVGVDDKPITIPKPKQVHKLMKKYGDIGKPDFCTSRRKLKDSEPSITLSLSSLIEGLSPNRVPTDKELEEIEKENA